MPQMKPTRTIGDKRYTYNTMVKDTKEQLEIIEKHATKFDKEGMKDKEVSSLYKRIIAANIYLDTIELYCRMNECYLEVMETKDDKALNNARKNIYQTIKLLESIAGFYVDTPLTENTEVLEKLRLMTPNRVLHLVKKLEYTIRYLEYEEGENSKWKGALIDIYGKFSAITKNYINFKEYAAKMYDPSYKFYNEVVELIQMVKRVIDLAARKFKDKYTLITNEVVDMRKAIEFLNLLVRIHTILNEPEQVQDAKKRIEVWTGQLETDLKKKEEEAEKARLHAARKGGKKK